MNNSLFVGLMSVVAAVAVVFVVSAGIIGGGGDGACVSVIASMTTLRVGGCMDRATNAAASSRMSGRRGALQYLDFVHLLRLNFGKALWSVVIIIIVVGLLIIPRRR